MAAFETLVSPDQASDWMTGDVVFVDCRFNLADPDAGRQGYEAAHIQGARYAHLDEDLSSPVTSTSGRHPLPERRRLAARLGEWGIGPETPVVAYDTAGGAMAGRLWWLLRWMGHAKVAVLDGGLAAWQAAGHPVSDTTRPFTALGAYPSGPPKMPTVDADAVADNIDQPAFALVDARAAPRFRGEQEPIDPVAGHVPGAVNRPLEANLQSDGRFKHPHQLREEWQSLLGGRPCVAMCGSGITACHHLLALEVAGLDGGRLYPGSWSEWIREPSHPVATNA